MKDFIPYMESPLKNHLSYQKEMDKMFIKR